MSQKDIEMLLKELLKKTKLMETTVLTKNATRSFVVSIALLLGVIVYMDITIHKLQNRMLTMRALDPDEIWAKEVVKSLDEMI